MGLPSGYEIREMTGEEFGPMWKTHGTKIFDDNSQMYSPSDYLSEDERSKAKSLSLLMENRFRLRLGLFFKNEFVGWAVGDQESAESFYMRNSAVLPGHRRKGLYTALMKRVMQTVLDAGFQRLTSRHSATNNDILIAKLKAGFVISSMEISDVYGVLVHLAYFPSELRRKMMVYRVGDIKPDDEIRTALKI